MFFTKLMPFDCQKSFANVVCGKYLGWMSSLVFMSLNDLFIKKIIFLRNIKLMPKEKVFCQKLSKCYIATSFDLWLFWGAHDIFVFVINFKGLIGNQSMLTIGLFKATVKYETSNLNVMKTILKFIVSYECLG